MKKLLLITAIAAFVFTASAQTKQLYKPYKFVFHHEPSYCVTVSEGTTYVSSDGKVISATVKLKSGARLTKAGTIIWRDGSRTKLENGQCVDLSGTIKGSAVAVTKAKESKPITERVHNLPEVKVAAEGIKNATKHHVFGTSDEDSNNAYEEYIKQAKAEVAGNDKIIAVMKMNLVYVNNEPERKAARRIAALEIENAELKNDLNNYIKYGTGYWIIFKNEFNRDLTAIAEDVKPGATDKKK
jgi:hypothetical protein